MIVGFIKFFKNIIRDLDVIFSEYFFNKNTVKQFYVTWQSQNFTTVIQFRDWMVKWFEIYDSNGFILKIRDFFYLAVL